MSGNRITKGKALVGGLGLGSGASQVDFENVPLGATISVAAEDTDVVAVTIQLTDANGNDLGARGSVFAYLSDDANGDSVAGTAPDGGVAIGTDGLAIPLVAGKAFQLVSEADGDIDLEVTESGADTWYLIVVTAAGQLIASDALTFTA
jgi:hypothetical protein